MRRLSGHHHPLPARPADLRRSELQLHHPVAAPARGGLPQPLAAHHPHRRARGCRRDATAGVGRRRRLRPGEYLDRTAETGVSAADADGRGRRGRRRRRQPRRAGQEALRASRRSSTATTAASSTSSSTSTRTRTPSTRGSSTSRARRADYHLELAMQWNAGYNDNVFSFANNINTHEGGIAPLRLPGRAHPHHQRLRPLQGLPQGEGGEPQRRGRARGPGGHPQRQAAATRSSRARPRPSWATPRSGLRRGRRQPEVRRVPGGEPGRRQADHQQDRAGRPRPHGGPQGPRPDPAQERPREHHAARQAGRLLHPRPGLVRALPGGGRLRRRLGQAGARPELPGHPAAAGQDHQRGEGPAQQDPLQQRDPGHHQRLRHQPGRRVRPRPAPATTSSSS